MILYTKIGKRYRPSTPGEIIATAQECLQEMGLSDIATSLAVQILDRVGYQIPPQVLNPVVKGDD